MPFVFEVIFFSISVIGGSANPDSIVAVTGTTFIPAVTAKPL